jgi:plastin-1
MEGFKDKSLANSHFIVDLLWSCQPDSVNYDLLTPGQSDEEKMLNAQYAISCARKMGCAVFLLWEDIVEVKEKMMLTFFGAVMSTFGSA